VLEVCRDNEDPWGMTVDGFTDVEDHFRLMTAAEANAFTGYPEETGGAVRIVENGAVRMKVQAFFTWASNKALVEYTVPKADTYVDVQITLLSNEPNKMIKYVLHTGMQGTPMGQTAFGEEALYRDLRESVFHKWCGIRSSDAAVYVLNEGTYGGSFTENSIRLSLLRTPVYSAHPIEDRQIAPHDRALEHMDMGQRRFHLRITASQEIDRQAQIFNEAPRVMSFFPAGDGEPLPGSVTLDDPRVLLSSLRKTPEGYAATLFNTAAEAVTATLTLPRGEAHTLRLEAHALRLLHV